MAYTYNIGYGTSISGPFTTFATGVATTSETVTGLTAGTNYYFQIIAVDSVTGLSSNPVIAGPYMTTATSNETAAGTLIVTTAGTQSTTLQISSTPGSVSSTLYPCYITTGGAINVNGTTVGGSGVVQLYYINHCCYQYNGTSWYGAITTTSTGTFNGDSPVYSPIPSIVSIALSASTFSPTAPTGTVIGTVNVTVNGGASTTATMNSVPFTGTITLGWGDATGESPEGTMSATGPVVASSVVGVPGAQNSITVSGGVISINGTAVSVTNGVTNLYKINHNVYQYANSTWFGPVLSTTNTGSTVTPAPTSWSTSVSPTNASSNLFSISGTTLSTANASMPAGNYTISVTPNAGTSYGVAITGNNVPQNITLTSGTSSSSVIPITPAALPSGWSVAFFDDFTSSSTITSSQTATSGYNWYYNYQSLPTVCNVWGTTTLAASITSTTATTITVTSASNFVSIGGGETSLVGGISAYQIQIDNEIMNVTGGFGTTTWTVTRGLKGSTASTHANGAIVAGTANAVNNSNTGGGNNASTAGGILQLAGYGSSNNTNITTCIPDGTFNAQATTSSGGNGWWYHAYFEAYIQFVYQVNGPSSGDRFPAFWSWSVGGGTSTTAVEIDFFECYWPNGPSDGGTYPGPYYNDWSCSDPGGGGSNTKGGSNTNSPDNQWHTYGCLWVSTGTGTGQITCYVDGTQYGTPCKSGTGNPLVDLENVGGQSITLGSGQGWNIYVDWVRVWTATGT